MIDEQDRAEVEERLRAAGYLYGRDAVDNVMVGWVLHRDYCRKHHAKLSVELDEALAEVAGLRRGIVEACGYEYGTTIEPLKLLRNYLHSTGRVMR